MENSEIYQELTKIIPKEKIQINEPMKNHTSFRIGGNADFFVTVSKKDEIISVINFANRYNIPITTIGNGSNILVTDEGIRGITVKVDIKDFSKEENDNEVIYSCGSGLPLTQIANNALNDGLTGLEFAFGIPGSLGGAVYMNAGAYGGELKDIVIETTYITNDGIIKTIDKDEHEFSYRSSVFQKNNAIIIESKLLLKKGNKEEIKQKMDENMQARRDKQPLEYPSAGSVFKRGDGFIAAKLIDECGLKGTRIGDAEVSQKHAGFIINKGNATAKDVLELTKYIEEEVEKKTGYKIEKELLIIGEI